MRNVNYERLDRLCDNWGWILRALVREHALLDESGSIPRLRDNQVLYLSNHASHFDYLQQLYTLRQRGLPFPRIAARANVFIPGLAELWKDCGAVELPFGKMTTKESRELITKFEKIISAEQSVFIYPEGGRSYNGEVGNFKEGGVKHIHRITAEQGREMLVSPQYIAYEPRPIEGRFFPLLNLVKGKLRNVPYVATDLLAFATALAPFPRRAVVHAMGQPFPISECKDGREVCDRAREQILEMQRKYR